MNYLNFELFYIIVEQIVEYFVHSYYYHGNYDCDLIYHQIEEINYCVDYSASANFSIHKINNENKIHYDNLGEEHHENFDDDDH